MEYFLIAYIMMSSTAGVPTPVNNDFILDTAAQCTAALTAFEASDGSASYARGTCLDVGAGTKENLTFYAASQGSRSSGGFGISKYTSAAACAAAKTAFEASDGSNDYARAACIEVPLGGYTK